MTHANNKEAAIAFLTLASRGDVRAAFDTYASPAFRHHNPFFRGDAASLAAGMAENAKKNPEKTLDVKQAIAEGDRVAVHSHVRMKLGDRGAAVVHLFRFEGGKIAELWDLAMPVPEASVNENGAF